MALLELSFANPAQLKKEGRVFDCANCPNSIQKIRRCKEDKEFTAADGAIWPMYINKGGTMYNYCPGKATWDAQAAELFHRLVLMCEMKVFPRAGGIDDQDSDIIETLAWFLPKYDIHKFMQRAEMVLGGDSSDGKKPEAPKIKPRGQSKGR
jgi:hypothetical protein